MRRTLLPLAGLVALATPAAVLAWLCWWLVVSAEMPARSWPKRLALGVLVVYATNAAVLTGLSELHRSCDPTVLLGTLLTLGALWRLWRPAPESAAVLLAADAWSVGFGAATFAVLWMPFVGASTGKTMALLSRTTDGGTHVQLVRAVMRQRGYVQLTHGPGLSPGADHYPTAWHANVWLFSEALGSPSDVGRLVQLVALTAVAGYALLAALAAWCVLDVSSGSTRPRPAAALMALSCLALTVLLGFGVFFLQLASYTQVVAVAALLVAVLLTAWEPGHTTRVVTTAGACSVVVMQSWYLLAPLLAAALLVLAARLRPTPRQLTCFLVVVVPLCLYPIVTGPAVTHVDLPGPVLLPTAFGIVGLLAATGVACVGVLRSGPSTSQLTMAAVLVAALLSLVVLLARHGFTSTDALGYYGAKVLLTSMLLGTVLACGLIYTSLEIGGEGSRSLAAIAVVGIALGTLSTRSTTIPPSFNRYEGHLYPGTLEAIYREHPAGPPRGTEAWVVDGCDRVWDRVATKWLYDTSLTWTTAISQDLADYSFGRPGDATALRSRLTDPSIVRLELFVHEECDRSVLDAVGSDPKVRVIRVP